MLLFRLSCWCRIPSVEASKMTLRGRRDINCGEDRATVETVPSVPQGHRQPAAPAFSSVRTPGGGCFFVSNWNRKKINFAGYFFEVGKTYETGWWGAGELIGRRHGELCFHCYKKKSEEHKCLMHYDEAMMINHIAHGWFQMPRQLELSLCLAPKANTPGHGVAEPSCTVHA